MDPRTLAIPLYLILLSAVLCAAIIRTNWKWWIKLVLIVVLPGFGLVVWPAIDSHKGYPAKVRLPEKALFFSGLVREPDPSRHDPGVIYVWLLPFDEKQVFVRNPLDYVPPEGTPRAYELPYSRSLHKAVAKGTKMVRAGKPAVLGRGKGHGQGDGDGDGDGDGEGDGDGNGSGRGRGNGHGQPGYGYEEDRQDFQIYELPPAEPPRKAPE